MKLPKRNKLKQRTEANIPFLKRILGVFTKLKESIKFKLFLAFIVPIIFIAVLGISAYTSSSKSIINTFTKSTVDLVDSTAGYYATVMDNIQGKATQLSIDNDAKEYYHGTETQYKTEEEATNAENKLIEKYRKAVKNMQISDKRIENIAVFTSYGFPVTTYGSLQVEDHFANIIETEEGNVYNSQDLVWTGYHEYLDDKLGNDSSKYAISLTKQYLGKNNKPMGFVQIDVNMNYITDALIDMQLPEGSKVAFISGDGREISIDGDVEENIFANQTFINEAIEGENKNYSDTVKYNGENYLFILSKVLIEDPITKNALTGELLYPDPSKARDTGAIVAALIPQAAIASQANTIKTLTIVIVFLALIVSGVIAVIVTSGIGKAINNIIVALSKVTEGDLTVSVITKRKDEFKVLTDSINNMIKTMKGLISKTLSIGNTVMNSSDNVANDSEILLTASKDISTAISEIQEGIVQQASDAEECLKQTDQLSEKITMVQNNSVAIEKISSDTKNVVKEGIDVVNELNVATKANIDITNETLQDINELDVESKSITKIINVINDIAEQTNLLSLNASIEAARAGDAGRGFSVVADEIRKLSLKSVESASEIEEVINRITKKTGDTVNTVKRAETISEETAEKLKNVIDLFNNVNVHVDELSNNMSDIAVGVKDINNHKNDVLHAIENISAIAEETSAASEEVDATAQQQLEAVTRLNESTKSLNKDAVDLDNTIKTFIID